MKHILSQMKKSYSKGNSIITSMMKLIAALLLVMFGATQAYAQSKVIKLGSLSWEDQLAVSLPTKRFLEKSGYTVEFKKFSEWGIAFAALNKGDVDLLLSGVNYLTADHWSKNKDRLEKVSVASHGIYQGLVVPNYVNIDSVDQLNSIADKVGGKIIGIEPGSGLMREANQSLKSYGLKYQLIDGSTAAMIAQLESSLQRKEPIVTMLWTPSWMMMKYDVKFLKDPKGVFAPPQSNYWIARKGFSEKNPGARETVASVYIPLEDIAAIDTSMKNGMNVDQAVDAWWKKNTGLIDRWSVMSAK